MTQEEFNEKWKRLSTKQRRFVLRYIENGFDPKEAAEYVGYNPIFCQSPVYRIVRKVNDVIDFLISKNDLCKCICKPSWIYSEYMKLYNSTTSEITKQAVLDKLSKILQMQSDGAKVEVTNNIPSVPVTINFGDE
jgi:hypothetical protein